MHTLAHKIDRGFLQRVMGNRSRARSSNPGGAALVSAAVLAETARVNKDCSCEELGLRAGYPVAELVELESGCTGLSNGGHGWVCPRLDSVRRKYGQ